MHLLAAVSKDEWGIYFFEDLLNVRLLASSC